MSTIDLKEFLLQNRFLLSFEKNLCGYKKYNFLEHPVHRLHQLIASSNLFAYIFSARGSTRK